MRESLFYNKIIMSANIEFKETNVERRAFTVKISGRDKLSQLLGTPVNKNYLHTEEYVYSTVPVFGKTDTSLLTTKVGLDSISGATLNVTVDSSSTLSDLVSPGEFFLSLRTETGGGTTVSVMPLGIVRHTGSGTIVLMRDSITQDITNIATRNGQSLKTTTVNSASKGYL